MPLSPFFANLTLRNFDLAISAKGYSAVRYADDLIFFADSEERCREIHDFCGDQLGLLGHTIPSISEGDEAKTRIFRPEEVADFLGLGICSQGTHYVAKITPRQIQKIKAELLKLSNPTELIGRDIHFSTFGVALQSRIDGYLHAYEDCVNSTKLQNELTSIGGRVKRTLLKDHLNISFDGLSDDARAFIGI